MKRDNYRVEREYVKEKIGGRMKSRECAKKGGGGWGRDERKARKNKSV